MRYFTHVLAAILISLPFTAIAGDLVPPGFPDDSASAVYTVDDIYNRLLNGTEAELRTGPFQEPAAGPGNTGHSLNELMEMLPEADNENGAAPGDVEKGKTYWGIRTDGGWGLKTGTAESVAESSGDAAATDVLTGKTFSNDTETGISGTMPAIGRQEITPSANPQPILRGYHDGTGSVIGDRDLVPENIAAGVEIFNIRGSAVVLDNTGIQTLSDTTAVVNEGYYNATTLTMVDGDLRSQNIASGIDIFGIEGSAFVVDTSNPQTLSDTSTAVNEGYYNATTLTMVDSDLRATNIASGINIFGINGSVTIASGNATDADVRLGVNYSNSNGASTGTMPTQALSDTNTAVNAGYYAATTLQNVDTDLRATNIASGINIFGVNGSAILATGNATDADVRSGVDYSSSGGASTGSMPTQTLSDTSTAVNEGYYAATTLTNVDTDLRAQNIQAGVTIFGVTGCAPMCGALILFNAGLDDGNLGGRAGADAFVQASMPSWCTNARAFLNISDTDEIRDMPGNYGVPTNRPVYTSAGVLIANDWNHLLDCTATKQNDLSSICAGQIWMHGGHCDVLGNFVLETGYTCQGFTSTVDPYVNCSNCDSAFRLDHSDDSFCNTPTTVLGLAW